MDSVWIGRWPLLVIGCCGVACLRSTPEIPSAPNGVTIAGRVVERELASGQLAPVPAVTVVSDRGARARSAPDGRFDLPSLPLGTHKLVFARPRSGSDPTPVKVIGGLTGRADGERLELGDVELRDPGTLHGGVSILGTTDPALAEGTLIAVTETAFRAIVGRDGRYMLAGLPEGGTFDVVAFRAGYAPGRLSGVSVFAHQTAELEPLVLVPSAAGGPITHRGSARVLDGEADHSGIAVTCTAQTSTASSQVVSASTDPAGAYSITLPYGIHRCVLAKDGYLRVVAAGVAALPEGVIGLPPIVLVPVAETPFSGADRDGDGCDDAVDAAPDEGDACADSDGDGVPDAVSTDDDGDGLSDAEEASPGRDGVITDGTRADSDGDGVPDLVDVCPGVADPSQTGAACAPGVGGELVITGLTPLRVGVGMPVTLRGRGFAPRADSHVVRFGGEVLAPALAVTRDRLTVIVPVGAEDGPVVVDNGVAVATSTAVLRIVPPPIVAGFSPTRAAIGATVVVRGQRLTAARAFVGGIEAVVVSASDVEVRFLVPPVAQGPQAIVISGEGGRVALTAPLAVLGPVRVLALEPMIVGPGQLLRIRGGGFSVGPGERVEVAFAGAAARAVATWVREAEVQVVVPDDAASGVVTVHHPAAVVAAPRALTVSPTLVVVRDIEPTIVLEGEAVRLRGNNLDLVTGVRVAGAAVPMTGQTASTLDFVAPVGTPAGWVTVESMRGTSTAPVGLSMIRAGTGFRTGARRIRSLVFDPVRDVLYASTDLGTLEGDIATGTWTSTFAVFSQRLSVDPAGRRFAFRDGPDRVAVHDMFTGQQEACDVPPSGPGSLYAIDDLLLTHDGRRAWLISGGQLVEVELDSVPLNCRAHGGSYAGGMVATDDENHLLVGMGAGIALIDISLTSPGRGSPVTLWQRPIVSAFQASFMWPPLVDDPESGVVPGSGLWTVTATSTQPRVLPFELVDPTTNGPPRRAIAAGNLYVQTGQRRFAVGYTSAPLDVVDLALTRRSVPPLPPLPSAGARGADPHRSRFATSSGEPGNYDITIYELEPAPPD